MDISSKSVKIFLSLFKVFDFSISGQVRLWWQVWWCPFPWETQWSEVKAWALLPEQKLVVLLFGQPPHPYSSSAGEVRSSFSDIVKRYWIGSVQDKPVECWRQFYFQPCSVLCSRDHRHAADPLHRSHRVPCSSQLPLHCQRRRWQTSIEIKSLPKNNLHEVL